MLLSCGVWSVYGSLIACASWIERLYVWEERGFTSSSLLHLHKSLFVPFSVLFLGQVIFPKLYGCLCVCCVYVLYVSVWCGGAPLSLSLWIVAGMVVEWRDSRADGEGMGPYCNCRHVEFGEAITGQGVSYPNLSCRSQQSCFIDCIKQCIIVFPLSLLYKNYFPLSIHYYLKRCYGDGLETSSCSFTSASSHRSSGASATLTQC
jgi:hypothetical protein